MSLLLATQISAIATAVLALFAIITATFAFLAFRKQSQEVRDQAGLLEIQSGQLDAQRAQLDEQRRVNERQIAMLDLQVQELQHSIEERELEREQRRRAQADKVYLRHRVLAKVEGQITPELLSRKPGRVDVASVTNNSDRPLYDVRLYWVNLESGAADGHGDQLGTIDPERHETRERRVPDAVASNLFVPIVYFRDAAGLRWTVAPGDRLAPVDPALAAGSPLIATQAALAYPSQQADGDGDGAPIS